MHIDEVKFNYLVMLISTTRLAWQLKRTRDNPNLSAIKKSFLQGISYLVIDKEVFLLYFGKFNQSVWQLTISPGISAYHEKLDG